MIYTSYFANLRKLPDNITPIAICLYKPKWYRGLEYRPLAPLPVILSKWKENHNIEEYISTYNNWVLNKLDALRVVNELLNMVPRGNTVCLVCFEKSCDFCHRHLVADWLKQAGFICEEWNDKKEI